MARADKRLNKNLYTFFSGKLKIQGYNRWMLQKGLAVVEENDSIMMTKMKLKEAETLLSKCRFLGPTVRAEGACDISSFTQAPFEILISSIISQQLSIKAASTIEGRVKKLVGEPY